MKYLEMPRPVRWEPMPHFNVKIIVPGMEISIIKIRWSWDHLIFIHVMGIPILIRQHLCIKMLLPQSLVNIMVSCYWWMGLIIVTIWIYFHSYTSMFSCYLNCCMFWAYPQEIWDWLLYFSMNYLKIILSKVFKSRRIENWFAQRPFQTLLWSFRFFKFNTLRPEQNGRHFADGILKCIFLNENFWILNDISLKCVP